MGGLSLPRGRVRTGAETWKYAADLDDIGRNPTPYSLTSSGRSATDLFHSGTLALEPADAPADAWIDDPMNAAPGRGEKDSPGYTDPWYAHALDGGGVTAQTEPRHEVDPVGQEKRAVVMEVVPDEPVGDRCLG